MESGNCRNFMLADRSRGTCGHFFGILQLTSMQLLSVLVSLAHKSSLCTLDKGIEATVSTISSVLNFGECCSLPKVSAASRSLLVVFEQGEARSTCQCRIVTASPLHLAPRIISHACQRMNAASISLCLHCSSTDPSGNMASSVQSRRCPEDARCFRATRRRWLAG